MNIELFVKLVKLQSLIHSFPMKMGRYGLINCCPKLPLLS